MAMSCNHSNPSHRYCVECGYRLVSQQNKSTCPECGKPFDLSDPTTFSLQPNSEKGIGIYLVLSIISALAALSVAPAWTRRPSGADLYLALAPLLGMLLLAVCLSAAGFLSRRKVAYRVIYLVFFFVYIMIEIGIVIDVFYGGI